MSVSINNKTSVRSVTKLPVATAEILRSAIERFQDSTYTQLRTIDCDFHEGILTLRGIVTSFFLKQLAQVTVADIRGVEVVFNRLEVR